MVKNFFIFLNKRYRNVHEAAIILGLFSLTSQVLGLLRDRALVTHLGPSVALDTYYAAFKVPDLIYTSIASLVAVTALIPFLTQKLGDNKDIEEARRFMDRVFSAFFVTMVVVCGLLYILMPLVVPFVAPGFGKEALHDLTVMSRIMLISPFFLGFQSLLGSIAQTYKKFFVFALAPVLYNLGILLGVFVLFPKYGIYGLALGVVIGAIFHFLIQVPTVLSLGFSPHFTTRFNFKELKEIIATALPRTLTLAMNTITVTLLTALASTLFTGSISILTFALNLQTFPIMMISVSYAIAAFPTLVETFEKGEKKVFLETLVSTARQIIFWSLPITALFIVLRAQIVRVVYGTAALSWNDTRLTAGLFAILSIGIIAQSLNLIFIRAYYASGRTKKPFYVSASGMVITLACAYLFVHIITTSSGFAVSLAWLLRLEGVAGMSILALGIAYCIGQFSNLLIFWFLTRKDFNFHVFRPLAPTILNGVVASIAVGIATYGSLLVSATFFNQNRVLGILGEAVVSGIFGIVIGILVLLVLRSDELATFLTALKHKFWKTPIIAPGQESVEQA